MENIKTETENNQVERTDQGKEATLDPTEYERTDQELKDQPEYKRLVSICKDLGYQI